MALVHVDVLLRLLYLFLRQADVENAISVAGRDVARVNPLGQREVALEALLGKLPTNGLDTFLRFRFGVVVGDGQDVAINGYLEVFLLKARRYDLQFIACICFIHIDGCANIALHGFVREHSLESVSEKLFERIAEGGGMEMGSAVHGCHLSRFCPDRANGVPSKNNCNDGIFKFNQLP